MLTNRHKRTGTTCRAAEAAPAWSCARVTRRGAFAAAGGSCLSLSPAYLLGGGETGLQQGAKSINDPRFMDHNNQT